MPIPPLAGICSYEEAARIGYSVEENVALLRRYAWFEKRAMEVGLYWINPTPEWEIKEALSYHVHLDTDHAGWIRKRVSEMRSPMPRMDVTPDPAIDRLFDEILAAADSLEKMAALYRVLKPALLEAYRTHFAKTNPIVDSPTRRMLRSLIAEEEEMIGWGEAAVEALTTTRKEQGRAGEWVTHLWAYLQAAGGIMGDGPKPAGALPDPRAQGEFKPDFFPQRDERFAKRWNFLSLQRQVSLAEEAPADERTLALMCRRAIEMDVTEYMSRIIAETKDQPWETYMDLCRQLWDEARHAMLGTIYFEHHGIDWKNKMAVHPGMAIRLNQFLSAKEAHAVLYATEQGLMPAKTGKRYEYEISAEAGDQLAMMFQDYDWADEVLHVRIGRERLLPLLGMSREEAIALAQEKRAETAAALDNYIDRGEQDIWWPEFVRHALGKETAMKEFDLRRR